jgi:hypothetical protein
VLNDLSDRFASKPCLIRFVTILRYR